MTHRLLSVSSLSNILKILAILFGTVCPFLEKTSAIAIATLFRGEQQKNVDWALVKACQTTTVDSRQGPGRLVADIRHRLSVHHTP